MSEATREPCPPEEQLATLLSGSVSDAERDAMLAHLDECESCREVMRLTEDDVQEAPLDRPGGKLLPGDRVGRYLIEESLGAGAMGRVYRALDPELGRRVAVKLLAPTGDDIRARQLSIRLRREAQAMGKLSHPNILQVFDVGAVGDQLFLVMELMEFGTLRTWLSERRRPWREVLRAMLQAGSGLAAAHEAGLVHRDFKPDNVLVAASDRVCVSDFGLVRLLDGVTGPALVDEPEDDAQAPSPAPDERPPHGQEPSLTLSGTQLGSPGYMAPEQIEGDKVDARADLFSYCVTLFEALYGIRPFAGRSLAELHEEVKAGRVRPPPSEPSVPKWLYRAIVRGLAARPEDRYPTMSALLGELRDAPLRRARRILGALLVVLAALGVALLINAYLDRRSKCPDAADELAGVWDAAIRGKLEERLEAAGDLGDRGAGLIANFQQYADQWVQESNAACSATKLSNERSDEALQLSNACFKRLKENLKALTRELTRGQAPSSKLIEGLPHELHQLTPPASCRAGADQANQGGPDDVKLREDTARARMLFYSGDLREAAQIVNQVIDEARRLEDSAAEADARQVLACVLTEEQRNTEAVEQYRLVTNAAFAAGESAIASKAWASSMSVEIALERYDEARALGSLLRSLLKWSPNVDLEATLHLNLGQLESDSEPEKKIPELRTALHLRERVWGKSSPKLAQEHALLSDALLEEGSAAEAVIHASIAAHRAGLPGSPEAAKAAEYAVHLADAELALGNNQLALQLSREAVELLEKRGNRTAKTERLGGLQVLGDALRASGQAEQALEVHRQAVGLLGPDDGVESEAEARTRLAEDLIELRQFEPALHELELAWAHPEGLGRVGRLLRAHHLWALARARAGTGEGLPDIEKAARKACALLQPMAAPREQQLVSGIDALLRAHGLPGCPSSAPR